MLCRRTGFVFFALLSVVSVQHVQSQGSNPWMSTDDTNSVVELTDTLSTNDNYGTYQETTTPENPPVTQTPVSAVNTPPPATPSADPVPRQQPEYNATGSSTEPNEIKIGIGIRAGVRLHSPDILNEYVTNFWNASIADYVYLPADEKRIGPGVFLSLDGTVDITPLFQVAAFAEGMWAGKQFFFRGGINKDIYVNTYTAMGGINLWLRVLNFDRTSLRLGAGGYGAYTILKVTGDISEVVFSGSGYGVRGLVGCEVRLTQQFVLTLDCGFPFGYSMLYNKEQYESSTPFPDKFEHGGFEIVPGIRFYF